MRCLLKKAEDSYSSQSTKSFVSQVTEQEGRGRINKSLGTQIMPENTPDVDHGSLGFNVCSAVFRSSFSLLLLLRMFPLAKGIFTLTHCRWKCVTWF